MKRTIAREIAVRLCYAVELNGYTSDEVLDELFSEEYYSGLASEDGVFLSFPDKKNLEYIYAIVKGVCTHKKELDEYISKYSIGWKTTRISKTALAVLEVAIFEMLYMQDVPISVSANEAVELSKKYEEDDIVPFINGVLGSFTRSEIIK